VSDSYAPIRRIGLMVFPLSLSSTAWLTSAKSNRKRGWLDAGVLGELVNPS